MGKITGTMAALAASATPAIAQDVDWSGAYAGIDAGYSWTEMDGESYALGSQKGKGKDDPLAVWQAHDVAMTGDGAAVAVHAGYNWQMSNWVFGVEASVGAGGDLSDEVRLEYEYAQTGEDSHNLVVDTTMTASLGARAGYAFDRTLIYATLGVSLAAIEGTATDLASGLAYTDYAFSDTLVGVSAGIGIEHMLSDNVSLRLEYSYTAYPSQTYELSAYNELKTDLTTSEITMGISWHF